MAFVNEKLTPTQREELAKKRLRTHTGALGTRQKVSCPCT